MSRLPEAAPDPDQPTFSITGRNLVVASPASITEACFSVPAVRALRNGLPRANLALLTPESILPLWNTVSGIDRLVSYPDQASVKEIGRAVQDLDLESSFHWEDSGAARALARAGVGQRLGYDLKPLRRHLTDKIPSGHRPGPVEHRVRFYMGLLEPLGIQCYLPKNFATPPLPSQSGALRLGLVPGSTFGGSYRWSIDRFHELGEALLTRFEIELAILGCPGHPAEANELARRFDGRVPNHAGQFDLTGLLDALPHYRALVASDGAVPHLAAHLGVPTVALFGPGDPVATRPLGRQHVVLSQHVECSPCNRPVCPLGHHRCLEELPVAPVLEAVTALLQPPSETNPSS